MIKAFFTRVRSLCHPSLGAGPVFLCARDVWKVKKLALDPRAISEPATKNKIAAPVHARRKIFMHLNSHSRRV